YTPEACLQFKDHFQAQVRSACHQRNTGTVGLKISKVVVVGDLFVGKTSLINRFCKDIFDRDYKATIGVDFEIERFEITLLLSFHCELLLVYFHLSFSPTAIYFSPCDSLLFALFSLAHLIPSSSFLCFRQWLEDALRENEPGSSFIFLVGTKKDLSGATCERTERDAIRFASEMQAEYWSVSAKTGENVKEFFSRVAALAFERSMLKELEKSNGRMAQIGAGNLISISFYLRCCQSKMPSCFQETLW
uniref:RAB36, member RAS onco family n=1 Tax=Crocodylus porosus TaxID=8502 RepID=A0A7M4E1U4_CROPO